MHHPVGMILIALSFMACGICYVIPTVSALLVGVIRRYKWKSEPESGWLNLLLLGAAIFGVVDHLWNGELFLIGPNLWKDIALGVVITLATFGFWGIIVVLYKTKRKTAEKKI